MLLGQNQNERKTISALLNKTFALRNDIVHGSESKIPVVINDEKFEIDNFVSQIEEYLRASIKKLLLS
jgi:hypothetical protein